MRLDIPVTTRETRQGELRAAQHANWP
jgi:hypothetical protein